METAIETHKLTPAEFDSRAAALLDNLGRSVESITVMVDVFLKKRDKIQKDFADMSALMQETKTTLLEVKAETSRQQNESLRAEPAKTDAERLTERQQENARREGRIL